MSRREIFPLLLQCGSDVPKVECQGFNDVGCNCPVDEEAVGVASGAGHFSQAIERCVYCIGLRFANGWLEILLRFSDAHVCKQTHTQCFVIPASVPIALKSQLESSYIKSTGVFYVLSEPIPNTT
jgi:hypothetical protein